MGSRYRRLNQSREFILALPEHAPRLLGDDLLHFLGDSALERILQDVFKGHLIFLTRAPEWRWANIKRRREPSERAAKRNMPTKTNGLLYSDYARAMKAAKRFGAKNVRIKLDGSIEFSFDEDDEELDAAVEPAPEPGSAGAPRQGWRRPPGPLGGRANDVIRDLLRSGGPVSTAQMRAELARHGYSKHALGNVLPALKDEIKKTEPGLYVLKPKPKLKW
jgi:hypothetical protein